MPQWLSAGTAEVALMNRKRQNLLSSILIIGIVFSVIGLAQRVRWRWDLTEEKVYSLSPTLIDLIGQLEDRLQIKLYFNRDIEGAEHLLPSRLSIQDRLEEIAALGAEYVAIETVDPTTDLVAARDAEHIGVVPLTVTDSRVGGVSVEKLYQGLELRYQDQSELIPFVVPNEFEFAVASRLASLLRGRQRPILGFFSREPHLPPPVPGIDQKAPPERIFENLRDNLASRFAIRDFRTFSETQPVPDDIEALIVAKPQGVTPQEVAQLDAYLKSGGHILALVDTERVLLEQNLSTEPLETGLGDWLKGFGIEVHPELIYDERCKSITIREQIVTLPDGSKARNPVQAPYGYILQLQQESLNNSHIVTAGLDLVEMFWAHPVTFHKGVGLDLTAEALLRTSERAYAMPAGSKISMDPANIKLMEVTAARSGKPQSFDLAIALSGKFSADATAPGLLVVVGDSEVFHNITFQGGASNATFADNLVDWLAQDESLIGLRSRGRKQRPLTNFYLQAMDEAGGLMESDAKNRAIDREARSYRDSMESRIAWFNVLVPPLILLVAGLAHFTFHRRRARRPYQSPKAGGKV
jgi:ABC-type uncharacterized transport system involved in gliding motility auxiliary subunit